jgi:hypothetical protein
MTDLAMKLRGIDGIAFPFIDPCACKTMGATLRQTQSDAGAGT